MAREKKRWSDSENFVIKAIIGKKLEESEEYIENISKVLNRGVGGVKLKIDEFRVAAGMSKLYSGSIR